MKKLFTPNDIEKFNYLSHPVKRGKLTAYVLAHADEESGDFISKLRLLDLENGTDTLLTHGDHSEKQPFFIPNGRLLYLSNESGEYQVYALDIASGKRKKLTSLRHGVIRYSASKNGEKLAFEATLWPEETEKGLAFTEMSAEEKAAWEKELDMRPYFITALTYKLDDWHGMRKGEFSHIGTANIDGTDAKLLDIPFEAVHPSLDADGGRLAFLGYPHDGPKGRDAEVFVYDTAKNEAVCLTGRDHISDDAAPVFTKDGRVVFMAYPELPDGGTSLLPFTADIETKELVQLMDADDEAVCHGVNPCVVSRTVYGDHPSYYYLSENGDELYFLSALKSNTRICKIGLDGGKNAELVLEGKTDICGFSMDENDRPVLIMGDLTNPGELYYEGERLTDHNAWLDEYEHGRVESFWIRSRDGKEDIRYFLMHPVCEAEGKLYPAVLDIKGGPTTMHSAAYWHEFHALASAGFAVIYGNPRGSMGFGHGYCAGPICWKNEAMHDILDMVEDAVSKGFIDRGRIGVTGGSYGGYMTNKLIGRTKYFRAAAAQRCLINPAVSYGTGDMGFINRGSVPKDFTMLAYLEDRARGNPITYIDNIDIPVLILHGFEDYRCGFEQAEQFFIAMKDRHPDVPVRLVMFPKENHGITRTGKLHSQIRHLSELVGWFEKYLREGMKDE